MKQYLFTLLLFSFFNTYSQDNLLNQIIHNPLSKNAPPTDYESDHWYYLDYEKDTILGISLERAYAELLKNKESRPVVIAVLDTDFDMSHTDMQGQFWTNSDEIPDNGIDDDENGYIDDIHGWNFLGTPDHRNGLKFIRMEETRIVAKYAQQFKNKDSSQIKAKDRIVYQTYCKAKASYDSVAASLTRKIKKSADYIKEKSEVTKRLHSHIADTVLTIEKLDAIQTKDSLVLKDIKFAKKYLKKGEDDQKLLDYLEFKKKSLEICMNLIEDSRKQVGDDQQNIKDIGYGSNTLGENVDDLSHGTKVAGILSALRNNGKGIDGISNAIKIMPLYFSAVGDYTDKDLALAIRYAVDNGAHIINISHAKDFSMQETWVDEALLYANEKNVLVVASAGNENINLDQEKSFDDHYPDDINEQGEEFIPNLIKVGAINPQANDIKWESSNYGKSFVDLFAPGMFIKVLYPNDKTNYGGGTSCAAPMVAGVAGLIKSYYPNLSAMEIKNIILDSGISYTIDVEVEQEDGSKKTIPFSELSKSGKVVNAYNAILMAEEVAKAKGKTK
ncbi:S8 family serine peptidase [Aquimarina sp. 2-A2]|uniref:S8 family serine peptidase n=1 Tax=Aquimarina sp. 2-A2 TaxID=3382644 RepID=UPI00387F1826